MPFIFDKAALYSFHMFGGISRSSRFSIFLLLSIYSNIVRYPEQQKKTGLAPIALLIPSIPYCRNVDCLTLFLFLRHRTSPRFDFRLILPSEYGCSQYAESSTAENYHDASTCVSSGDLPHTTQYSLWHTVHFIFVDVRSGRPLSTCIGLVHRSQLNATHGMYRNLMVFILYFLGYRSSPLHYAVFCISTLPTIALRPSWSKDITFFSVTGNPRTSEAYW